MALLKNSWKVADIAALKTLTSTTYPKQSDGDPFQVDDIGNGYPGFYIYFEDSTATEDLPTVVQPTNNLGRYLLTNAINTAGADTNSISIAETSSAPTTLAGQIKISNINNVPSITKESNGATGAIALYNNDLWKYQLMYG